MNYCEKCDELFINEYLLQGSRCYLEKIWNGISSALEIGSTQMGQEQTEQQNLGIGKPQGRIGR